jgi:hypothetical protein
MHLLDHSNLSLFKGASRIIGSPFGLLLDNITSIIGMRNACVVILVAIEINMNTSPIDFNDCTWSSYQSNWFAYIE